MMADAVPNITEVQQMPRFNPARMRFTFMIKTLIAGHHAIVRAGLIQIIAATTDIIVAGELTLDVGVTTGLSKPDIDLVLLEMMGPGTSGVDVIRRVCSERSTLPVLVLGMTTDTQIVSRVLRAGARGFISSDNEPAALLNAIRKLARGERFIDPKLVDAIVFGLPAAEISPHEILSNREFQVLHLLAAGKSINDIAAKFSLSAKTISTHKMRLMQKIGIPNNAELIRYAISHGIASEPGVPAEHLVQS